jgi:hypothetical protein
MDLPEKAARKIRELERAGRLTDFLYDLRPNVLEAIIQDGPSEAEERQEKELGGRRLMLGTQIEGLQRLDRWR